MNQDLKYLAETVSEWGSVLGLSHIVKSGAKVEYVAGKCVDPDLIYRQRGHRVSRAFTRAEWQAARDELLAPEIGIVESFLGSPFSTPDEDEEWEKIERRMDFVGLNGPTGCHYNAGEKHDAGKPAMHLIPANIEVEVSRVLQFGAEKYGPENWRLVPDLRNRYMGAAMRHVNAMRQGEALDEESGLHHAAHAICCLMFIGETEMKAGPE